ncbi:hypothetical protein MPTK1_7g09280 [Marchantia polymorpha subsp. ruderalis]|uniref:GOLD domain-containing protein n=2 Tax=Marchantia polymorpha TaxID=3197 RepID=A0AAF6BXQ4_MARPO|nr:hypothetical protein MARPO_0068s0081 [Marchantia polymorpha]PTQ35872.1 hypothetical protein MARPO_0068s0081 [Marchantia polymorpha]BBN16788.1 hypothetical protein Mp_7g09280 [Marchantia polymorpha subsp. ruderalis]BBN16789.1 hypothetical protein Mp_7g09280 [Marchantia polymorpha subsp. ruderalis]|eukprot:PTQ35871.1 hypothetical protein MARPO_0068s0081 [Marchantia polymorpha]
MEIDLCFRIALLVLLASCVAGPVQGIRFVLDRKECFSHEVHWEHDNVDVSFVVIKADNPWSFNRLGVDLTVEAPNGRLLYNGHQKEDDKFEFEAPVRGFYRFCFSNISPMHETIDFDVHIGHITSREELAKPEDFDPLLHQISVIEEALYGVRFEQHWLQAQTDHQAIMNEAMSRRVIYKALLESAALVACSFLQVFLLQRLFERKLGKGSRV